MRDERSLSDRAATAGAWVIGGKFCARGIDFVTLLILARLLRPADFGLAAMAMAVILIVEAVLELPLMQALVRVPNLTTPMFDTAFTLGLLRGLTIAVLLCIAVWPISIFYEDERLVPLILALALAPIIRGMVSPRMAIFMQRFDLRREVAMELAGKTAALTVAATLAATTGSYWAIAAGTITTPLVMVALSYSFAWQRPRLTLSEWPLFANMIGWNSVSQAIAALNWQMDKILLGRFVDISAFGRFVVADNLSSVPQQAVVSPLIRPLVAAFAPLSDRSRLVGAYYKATTGILMIAAPILLTIALLADPAVRILLGEQWLEAALILQWLALCNIIALPMAAMPPLAMAIDRTRILALRSFLEFSIGFPILLAAVIHFGVHGAIGARAITNIVAVIAVVWILKRLVGVTVKGQLQACWRPTAALLPMAAFLLVAAEALEGHRPDLLFILYTMAAAAAGLIIYFGSALAIWTLCRCPPGPEILVLRGLKSIFRPLAARLE